MYCGCGTKKHETDYVNKETIDLVSKTNFSENEINELRNRFYKISNSSKKLSKVSFKENMGILGLDTAFLLSERVFQIMDEDQDGEISLQDFILYMDILLNGTKNKKNELAFLMIDHHKRGFFDKADLRELIESTITVWTHLTGNHLNEIFLKKIELYIDHCFSRMDFQRTGKIKKEDFINAIEMEPDLLEIFDFLNKGGKMIFTSEDLAKREHDERINRKIIRLERNLKKVNEFIQENHPHILQNDEKSYSPSFSPFIRDVQSSKLVNNNDRFILKPKLVKEEENIFSPNPPVQASLKPYTTNTISVTSLKTDRASILYPRVHGFEKNMKRILHEVNRISPDTKKPRIEENEFDINQNKESFQFQNVFLENITPDLSYTEENKKQKGYISQVILKDDIIFDGEESGSFSMKKFNNFTFNNSEIIVRGSSKSNDNIMIGKKKKVTEKLHFKGLTLDIDSSPFNLAKKANNAGLALKEMLEITKEIREDYEKNLARSPIRANNNINEEKMKEFKRMATFTVHNVHKSIKMKKPINKTKRKTDRSPTQSNNNQNKTVVFLGHQNWNLVLNMMLGIQMAVKSTIPFGGYHITSKDFELKYYFELVPRRSEADKKTMFKICKFFDYAPHVFNELRNLFGISKESYLSSIGPENLLSNLLKGNLNTLRELVSSGKSGSFFYYSSDGKFTLKTISRGEFHLIRKILPHYYGHLLANPNSFIVKFFGLHKMRLKLKGSMRNNKIYFIIMSNVFQTPKEIHERYDLKGSKYKRFTKENDPSIALKDNNAIEKNFKMKLTKEHAKMVKEQLKNDCSFFEKNSIIDYSFLVGVHHNFLNKQDSLCVDQMDSISNEIFMPSKFREATAESKLQYVGFNSYDESEVYYMGVIDILTSFNSKKKFEYGFKYLLHGSTISAIPPLPYSRRFQAFISNIIETPP